MARYYMPTFITDLHQRHGKKFVSPLPGLASGFTQVIQVPEFDIEKADVSASNQTRWNSAMKRLFDWGHLPASTSLDVITSTIPVSFGPYSRGQAFSGIPVPGAASHLLNELSAPFGTAVGDGNPDYPDPDADHSHPETYNPNFTIPSSGVYPYQINVRAPASQRTHILAPGDNDISSSPLFWSNSSLQESDIETSTTTRHHPQLYPYGNFLSMAGVEPHGGWFLYGLYGVSGSSEFQEYDLYWITPKFYKIHDGIILTDSGTRTYARGWENLDDYRDVVDPTNPWYTDDKWMQLFNSTGADVILDGGTPADPGPPGMYYYRRGLGTGDGSISDPAGNWDTWEWRREYYLAQTTPGQGFIKRRHYAQVFPLMRLEEERETEVTLTTGLIREPRPDDQAGDQNEGMMEAHWIPPIRNYKTETDTRIRRKKIAEYGL